MSQSLQILGPLRDGYAEILSDEACAFLADLARTFRPRIRRLLEARREAQARYDSGHLPRFLEATEGIRSSSWTVAPLPADLLERRVEITGPTDRKMVINALNSGSAWCRRRTPRTSRPTRASSSPAALRAASSRC